CIGAARESPLVRVSSSAGGADARVAEGTGNCLLGLRFSPASCPRSGNSVPKQACERSGRGAGGGTIGTAHPRLAAKIPGQGQSRDFGFLRCAEPLSFGKVRPGHHSRGKGGFEYRYDPARPESVLARSQVNDALQSVAGRKDPIPTSARISSEPGARYIDFLIPGLLGM